mmetsp:Transcript_22904/g.28069  ORF Transcript_22904/g.28069 Transcript_22904/m.28069 type:complete len:435 (+) Transcript_22904:110-1414(+)
MVEKTNSVASPVVESELDLTRHKLLSGLSELRNEAENEALTIKTLGIVVKNVLLRGHEEDSKFRTLRLSNVNLMNRLLQHSHAKSICIAMGFVHNEEKNALILPADFKKEPIEILKGILDEEAGNEGNEQNSKKVHEQEHENGTNNNNNNNTVSVEKRDRELTEEEENGQFRDWLANKRQRGELGTVAGGSSSSSFIPAEQVGITVYCDLCNKARVLTKTEEAAMNLSEEAEWNCNMVPRIRDLGGCEVTDDEIIAITGEGFGFVLSKAGILTRAHLACCEANEFDAGPYAPYLEKWIRDAQRFELDDIMKEVFEPENDEFLNDLFEVGISSPKDIIDHVPSSFVRLFKERLGYDGGVTEELVKQWQEKAAKKADEIPWLQNYEYAHMIEVTESMEQAQQQQQLPMIKPKPLKIQLSTPASGSDSAKESVIEEK